MSQIRPIREDSETVTLSRRDYETLRDTQAVSLHRADEMRRGAPRDIYLTGEETRRILAGEPPLRVWRTRRGMTQRALAAAAALSPSYLNEIETGAKPGSTAALRALAGALHCTIEDLLRD